MVTFFNNYVKSMNLLRYFSSSTSTMKSPIVTMKDGKVRGAVDTLLDGSSFFSFKGLPYASPPTGKLRFKAPLPLKPWIGVHDAIEHGPVCPHIDMQDLEIRQGDENCLFLNVYTRSLQPDSKLPVMVYFHGGGFMSGSGNSDLYGPRFLLQHDVIVVTVNYRLGILGFLCLDTPEFPGNAGIKDQVAALQWVQRNIKHFGGNPDNVTVFGESAGGASVTYHLLSPMSKGLFHRAIAQSGVCTSEWAIGRGSRERAFGAGKLLGKETDNDQELMEHLCRLPAVDLAAISLKMGTKDERHRGLPLHFVPVVEKKFDGVEPFIDEEPLHLLLSGKAHDVPIVLGYNSAEGLFLTGKQLKKRDFYNRYPYYFVPRDLAAKVSQEKCMEFGDRIKQFYFGEKGIQEDDVEKMTELQSDLHFAFPTQRFASLLSPSNPSTFVYRFDCDTKLNLLKILMNLSQYKGAGHVDDQFYIFDSELNRDLHENDEESRRLIHMMTKLLTDFAKTGRPSRDDGGAEWPPYSSGRAYLSVEQTRTVRRGADGARFAFWMQLLSEAGLAPPKHNL